MYLNEKTRSFQENSPVMNFIKHRFLEGEERLKVKRNRVFLYFEKHICQYYRMDCFYQTSNYHLFKIAPRFDPVDAFWDIRLLGTLSRCGEVREIHLYPLPVGRE